MVVGHECAAIKTLDSRVARPTVHGMYHFPARAAVCLSACLVLAACGGGRQPVSDTTSSTDVAVNAAAASVLVRSDGAQLLRSSVTDDLYATVCDGSVQLSPEFAPLDDSLPDFAAGESVAFDVADRSDGSVRHVRLRCLPADFPLPDVVGTFTDWLTLSTMSFNPGTTSWQILLEPNGFPAWFTTGSGPADFYTTTDGEFVTFDTGTRTSPIYNNESLGFRTVTSDGTVQARWLPTDGVGLDNHALTVLPDGNAIGLRYVPAVDKYRSNARPIPPAIPTSRCVAAPATGRQSEVRGQVVEIAPTGQVVRSWDASTLPSAGMTPIWVDLAGPSAAPVCVLDVEHLNAVSLHPDMSRLQVLVTGRGLNGAVLLDWETGEIVWSLGVKDAPAALRILNDPLGGPVQPHDANFIDSSHVLIYDNRIAEPSRALVYEIDAVKGTATLVRSFLTQCAAPGKDFDYCKAPYMGSARPTIDKSGIVVGIGAAATTAAEFALTTSDASSSSSPRATLRLPAGIWSYRALPSVPFDSAALFDGR